MTTKNQVRWSKKVLKIKLHIYFTKHLFVLVPTNLSLTFQLTGRGGTYKDPPFPRAPEF